MKDLETLKNAWFFDRPKVENLLLIVKIQNTNSERAAKIANRLSLETNDNSRII